MREQTQARRSLGVGNSVVGVLLNCLLVVCEGLPVLISTVEVPALQIGIVCLWGDWLRRGQPCPLVGRQCDPNLLCDGLGHFILQIQHIAQVSFVLLGP